MEPQQGFVCPSVSPVAVTRFMARSAVGQRRKETGRGGVGGTGRAGLVAASSMEDGKPMGSFPWLSCPSS